MRSGANPTNRRLSARERAKASSSATAALMDRFEQDAVGGTDSDRAAGYGSDRDDMSDSGGLNYLLALTKGADDVNKPAALHQQHQPSSGAEMRSACVPTGNHNTKEHERAFTTPAARPAAAAERSARAAEAAAAAEAASATARPRYVRPDNIPKWIRVGEKVRFSTVVSAVLIPSIEDISAATKQELWWQAADFYEFRMNHARRQHGLLKDEGDDDDAQAGQRQQQTASPVIAAAATPYGNTAPSSPPATPSRATPEAVAVNGNNNEACGVTATVQGVLVLAAAPAPAPVSSRPRPVSGSAAPGVAVAGGRNKDSSRQKKGHGATSGLVHERVVKPAARERDARARCAPAPGHNDQQKNISRRFMDGRRSVSAGATYHGGHRLVRGNRQTYYAGPSQDQFAARGGYGNMNNAHRVAATSGQFYVNGNFARVNGSAPPRIGCPPPSFGNGPPLAEAFPPAQHQLQHMRGCGMGAMAMGLPQQQQSLAPPAMMVQVPDSEQFSMWRSQLVFAPARMQ